jgi:peptidoglycan-associated lipoprotein
LAAANRNINKEDTQMTHLASRFSGSFLLGVCLVTASACSSTPTPRSAGDFANALTTASKGRAPRSAADSANATTIAIDDAILRACHLSADAAYFPFDSARLESQDQRPLDAVANCFTHGELKGRSLKLVGRADPRGDDEYNMVLGQSRADRVGSALTRDGLERSRISETSRGDLDAKGHDESGWSKDRRVDVLLGS